MDSKLRRLHGSDFENIYHFLPKRLYKDDLVKLANVTGNNIDDHEWDDLLNRYGTEDKRNCLYCTKTSLVKPSSGLSKAA